MKIIFLDIDGVLNSRMYDRMRNWNEQTDIDETRLPLIKEIVDATGAKIVLSSTWRKHWDKDENLCDRDGRYINETFAKFCLSVYDKTPDIGAGAPRKAEVSKWLKDTAESIEAFVIIDDYRYGWEELSERFVKTEPNFRLGIEREHAERAIAILNETGDFK